MGAPLMNRVTLLHLLNLEGGAFNPAQVGRKYNLPASMAIASRCIDLSGSGLLERTTPPTKEMAIARTGMPAAWWKLTKKGTDFIKANKADIIPLDKLHADIAERHANDSLKPTAIKKPKDIAPAVVLNKKANAAVDGISQLIEDYNKSHALLLQIGAMINNYMKDNQAESVEE